MGDDARLDVIVVGGGPAGLSAALMLGRCRRRVLVVDAGAPRNRASRAAHGLFTRDGAPPHELLRIARAQLAPYDVDLEEDEAVSVVREADGFTVTTRAGAVRRSRKLLLATGVRDLSPDVPGVDALFGKGVYVCPYCDGWENRDRRLGVWAAVDGARDHALAMLTWSADVTLFTSGEALDEVDRDALVRRGVVVVTGRITRLDAEADHLVAVVLEGGHRVPCDALFVHHGQEQGAPFAVQLGCALAPNGTVRATKGERSGVPGLWVAGDASHDMQLLAVACAEGVKAACAINQELREEAFR